MTRQRIHVLGLGSIGTFAAHCLADVRNLAQTTLLLHRASLLEHYHKNGSRISLHTRNDGIVHRGGYDFEILSQNLWKAISGIQIGCTPEANFLQPAEPAGHIANLIVSVKAAQTVNALQSVKHRLSRDSTILFLQNGSGMVEAVNECVFTNLANRPNYMVGVISHGVGTEAPFSIVHTGPSATSLGLVPRSSASICENHQQSGEEDLQTQPGTDLMRILCSIPRFNAKSYTFTDILQLQLEKLAVNAFSNPICALNDVPAGFCVTIPETRHRLMSEISAVVLKLPELYGIPGVEDRFCVERLEKTVGDIIEKNKDTICSMVYDMRAGRKTEVEFINGYWSRRGREVGVETPVNDELVANVEAMTQQKTLVETSSMESS